MREICLVNPRFDPSYWGFEYALPVLHKRAAMPVAALPLLAALTPAEYRVTILDENIEPLDFDRIARADLVALTGMSVQRYRMMEILKELKARGVYTVVGGPWVTVQEDYFGELADVIFVGEAEETWPQFLSDWAAGSQKPRYEQTGKTDLSRVPVPRYDLLKMNHYLFGSIQMSRGCPFQCEFCDIIVTFGRKPRYKTAAQVLAELDALYEKKMEIVFIVDDNLIGNRQFIRAILPEIAAWQKRRGYPFIFAAEASLDVAEDDELLRLMLEANIVSVFIGVETPNEEALKETRKFQNLARNVTVLDRIHKVQRAGIEVWCGMILGFDHDTPEIFEWQRKFLKESGISEAMVGMLFAIPKTPLHARLAAAGRLDRADRPQFGTNVIPVGMSREELSEGYVRLMHEIYSPDEYFGRVNQFLATPGFRFTPSRADYLREHPLARLKDGMRNTLGTAFLFLELMRHVKVPELRRVYRQRLREVLRRRDPALALAYTLKCVMHYHHFTMTHQMETQTEALVNAYQ